MSHLLQARGLGRADCLNICWAWIRRRLVWGPIPWIAHSVHQGQPLSYYSKRKPLGHFCCLLQVTMTLNRQHLTVREPLAALGEIMITREKSYYCHHAFIMQMILR